MGTGYWQGTKDPGRSWSHSDGTDPRSDEYPIPDTRYRVPRRAARQLVHSQLTSQENGLSPGRSRVHGSGRS
jgi:hypothetical protein